MSDTDDLEGSSSRNVPVTAAKGIRIRAGHKAHITKMLTSIDKILKDFDLKNEIKLLASRDNLKRKAAIVAKLDEDIIETLENDDEILEEMENSEKIQLTIQEKIIEVDRFLKRVHEKNFEG